MTDGHIDLDRLNGGDAESFAGLLAGIVEHAPKIARTVAAARPFASVEALHAAFFAAITALPREAQVELLRGHPELAGREAEEGGMTPESVAEQGGAGLDRLSREDAARLRVLNRDYRDRFGFPFLVCVRRHTLASILAAGRRRLSRDREAEIDEALGEVFHITRLRLDDRVREGPGGTRAPAS